MATTTTLYYRDDKSDKQYSATVDGRTVTFAWGRRGSTQQTKVQTCISAYSAQIVAEKQLDSKRAKGYREGPAASRVIPPQPFNDGYDQARGRVNDMVDRLRQPPAQSPRDHRTPPTCIAPRLLNDIDQGDIIRLVEDDDWWVQIKHDGDRVQLHANGTVNLFSGRSAKLRACPASITDAALRFTSRHGSSKIVLDGEQIGDTLWAFDLLQSGRDGLADLRQYSYDHRYMALCRIVDGIGDRSIQLVWTAKTKAEKAALILKAKADGNEGVVFIRKSAPYTAGRPNRGGDNLRWKFTASATLIVAKDNRPAKDSVDVALADGTTIGTCSTIGKTVRLGQFVEVEYLYAQGLLVQPRIKGIRTDVMREDVTTRAQLQFKGGVDPAAIFKPAPKRIIRPQSN